MKSALDIIRKAIAATGLIHAKPAADAEAAAADHELDALEARLRSLGVRIRQSSDDEVEYSFAFTVNPADAEETVARAAHGEDAAPSIALAQDDGVSALERARLECETTAEECRAKNKMACPYHGAQFMKAALLHHLAKCGAKTANVVIESYAPGSFVATVKCIAAAKERKAVAQALNDFIAMKGIDPAGYPKVAPSDYDYDKKEIEVPYDLMDEDTEEPDFDPSAKPTDPAAPPTPAKPAKAKKPKPARPEPAPIPEPEPPTPPAEPPPPEPEPEPTPEPSPEPEPATPKLSFADAKARIKQMETEGDGILENSFFTELYNREKDDPSVHELHSAMRDKLPNTEEYETVATMQGEYQRSLRGLKKLVNDIGYAEPSDSALDQLEALLAKTEADFASYREAYHAYEQKARDLLAETETEFSARKYPSTDYDDVKPDMETFADVVPAHVRLAVDTAATAVETAKADVDALAYAASAAASPLLRKTLERQLEKAKAAHAAAGVRYGKLRDAALREIDDTMNADEAKVTAALSEAEKSDGASASASADSGVKAMLAAIGAKEPERMAELADGEKAKAYAAKKTAAEKAYKEARAAYEKYHATSSRKERKALLEEAKTRLQTYSDAAEERDDAREDYLSELRAALPAPDPSAMDGVAMRKGETLPDYIARLKAEGREVPVSLKKLGGIVERCDKECRRRWEDMGLTPPTPEECREFMSAIYDNSAPSTCCSDRVADLILTGHFKNLFETNIGMDHGDGCGCTYKPDRFSYMEKLFGYPPPNYEEARDDEDVGAQLEKYGLLLSRKPGGVAEFQGKGYKHYFGAYKFGGAVIRFRKERVMPTITLDDSFACTPSFTASPVGDVSLCSLVAPFSTRGDLPKDRCAEMRRLLDSGAYKRMNGVQLADRCGGSYAEIQYHGAVGPECIESLNYQDERCLKTLSPEAIDTIHRNGINVYVKGKQVYV